MRALAALAVAALALATLPASGATDAPSAPVVIAVVDSGTNLYHEEFRDLTRASLAPWDYLPGYPQEDAEAVPLSLDAPSWDAAFAQDRPALDAMRAGHLYWFPGTKVVAAMSFEFFISGWPVLLDRPGVSTHGSMTTSRAVGNTIGLAGPDVRLVLLQASSDRTRADAIDWAASQPWIDALSLSFSGSPGQAPSVRELHEVLADAVERASHAKPVFASAGNGVGGLTLLGFPTWLQGMSGLPDVISVGSLDDAYVAQWSNQDPLFVTDGCLNEDIDAGSMDATVLQGSGTSSSAPWAAGGAARLVADARALVRDAGGGTRAAPPHAPAAWSAGRAADEDVALAIGSPSGTGLLSDGLFTLAELKWALSHTALADPTTDATDGGRCPDSAGGYVRVADVPAQARYPFVGYGELNGRSLDAAASVLRGDAPMPDRAYEDAQYARAHALKTAVSVQP